MTNCSVCRGIGMYQMSGTKGCPQCQGTGRCLQTNHLNRFCSLCKGRKYIPYRETIRCLTCGGSGKEVDVLRLVVTLANIIEKNRKFNR